MSFKKLKKSKINIKLFFITNYRPIKSLKKKSRYRFCKSLFLLLYFFILYIKKKYNQKLKKNAFLKNNQNILYPKTTGLNLKSINPSIIYFSSNSFFFLKKNSYFLRTGNYTQNSLIVARNIFIKFNEKVEPFRFNFLLFSKIYSHFVILRAPFRDKISKNILQHQRFFIYVNFIFFKQNITTFYNKYMLFWFLTNFQKKIPIISNIIFLQSQKITFFIKLMNLLN